MHSASLADSDTARRKALGAFYTPPGIASALVRWAVRSSTDRVLEPAAGEAAFLREVLHHLQRLGSDDPSSQVLGLDIDPAACREAKRVLADDGVACPVQAGNFLELRPAALGRKFTAIVGNPPYVRYHRFRGSSRAAGLQAAAAAGVRLSGLASSWAPFVIHATRFLEPEGRLGLVLPAELLHVDYAAPVRDYLLRHFGRVTVVTFDESVFPGASVDAVLLACEAPGPGGLRLVRRRNAEDLDLSVSEAFTPAASRRWSVHRAAGGGVARLEQLRESGTFVPLGSLASVDIGCVTGANRFFILTRDEARELGVGRRLLQPTIARPADICGALVMPSDARALARSARCLLLNLAGRELPRSARGLRDYLTSGERAGINARYKCSSRTPWYAIPGVRVPDAFLSYMSHRAPRVALNAARMSSTNLVHQITFDPMSSQRGAAIVAALHATPSLLSFELEGRSYGGGVLKHETREAERVLVPHLTSPLARRLATALPAIDRAVREGDLGAAASCADRVLIAAGVLTEAETSLMREAQEQLQARRRLRGRTSTQ